MVVSTKKTVYSRRLGGISYKTKIEANGKKFFIDHDKQYMYRKRFQEFREDYSLKPGTARKQRARFERHCRRILCSPDNIVNNPAVMDVEYNLAADKKHRFLFLKSQCFNKPISHLKYKKNKDLPYMDEYNHKIHVAYSRPKPVDILSCEQPSTSTNVDSHTDGSIISIDTPPVFTGEATAYFTSTGDTRSVKSRRSFNR